MHHRNEKAGETQLLLIFSGQNKCYELIKALEFDKLKLLLPGHCLAVRLLQPVWLVPWRLSFPELL